MLQGMGQAAKVGLVVVAAAALVVLSLTTIRADLFSRNKTYRVYGYFDNALGIRPGMPVKRAGSDVGWVEKSGYKDEVQLTEALIRIYTSVTLHTNDEFVIAQDGLIGEKYLSIRPAEANHPGAQLKDGGKLMGRVEGDFTELITGAANTVNSVNDLLSQEHLGGDVSTLLASMAVSLDRINGIMDQLSGVIGGNSGYVEGTMKNFQSMSGNFLELSKELRATTGSISDLANDPKYHEALSGASDELLAMSRNMNKLSSDLASLSGDADIQQNSRDSVRLTRETLESTKATVERFQSTLDKVDSLLDSADGLVNNVNGVVSNVGGTVSSLQGKIDGASSAAGRIDTNFRLNARAIDVQNDQHLGQQDKYVADMNVAVAVDDMYFQTGADNIGEDSSWNMLLGYGRLDSFSVRGGAYRGEMGLGLRYGLGQQGSVEAMIYDSNDPKVNAMASIPVADSINVVAGVEDIQHDAKATVGVGMEF